MVLFTSVKPLERAENLKTVYDAYDGDKKFAQMNPYRTVPDGIDPNEYDLQVTDELPSETVGKCLFISHGMGACKTYGLQQPHPYFNRPDLITYAIASSKDMVPIVAKYSGISEDQIVPTGLPRTDAYFIKPQKSDKRNYLYAPTFRAWSNWWAPEWGGLDGQLNDNEEFIVKPHMITKRLMTNKKRAHITEIDSMIPSTEYLLRANVLVTDYSSIMFDAFVMRTPVVLFAKDRMKYLRERGLYHSYPEWYSDYLCETEDDLVRTIRQAEWTPHMEELREYHAGACDGRSTERCIDLIRSML